MASRMTELRARWRRTIAGLEQQIEAFEGAGDVSSDAEPDIAAALWLMKLKSFRAEIEELLAAYPGD